MLTFVADARDGSMGSNACNTCCCQAATVRPGETNLWAIAYANWVAPIGGRGLVGTPVFDIQNVTPVVATAAVNSPPTNANYVFPVVYGTPFLGTVATSAVDPNADTMVYAVVPLYAPQNGTVAMNANGTFTYTPSAAFSGYDVFFYTTSDQINKPVMNQVTMRVDPALPAVALPNPPAVQLLSVPLAKVSVTPSLIRFPVIASPAIPVGSIWRVTVRASAVTCDLVVYSHISCFDVIVGAC